VICTRPWPRRAAISRRACRSSAGSTSEPPATGGRRPRGALVIIGGALVAQAVRHHPQAGASDAEALHDVAQPAHGLLQRQALVADALMDADGDPARIVDHCQALCVIDREEAFPPTLRASMRVQIEGHAGVGLSCLRGRDDVGVGSEHHAFLEAQLESLHQLQGGGGMDLVGLDFLDDGRRVDAPGPPGLVHAGRKAALVELRIIEIAFDRFQQLRFANPAGEGFHEAEVGLDRRRAHPAGAGFPLPVPCNGFHMAPTERAWVQLEVLGMAAQEIEQPEAEARPLRHGLVAHPLGLAAVLPVVPLQDQLQHIAAALGIQGDVVQRRLFVGARAAGAVVAVLSFFVALLIHGVFLFQSSIWWNLGFRAAAGSGRRCQARGLPPSPGRRRRGGA